MAEGASPAPAGPKSDRAFRTIGEVSARTGLAQHVLRYWETRFAQLRPVTRAGGRRYYRPEDIALVETIDRLLNREGYTIRGVQLVLAGTPPTTAPDPLYAVRMVRDALQRAIDSDG